MKISVTKLNAKGAAHVLIPLLIVVGAGIVGSFVAVKSMSHADSIYDSSARSYNGNDDGCGSNATHYSGTTHVGRKNYGKNSVCQCNNGKRVAYKAVNGNSSNPKCATKISSNNSNKSAAKKTNIAKGKCTLSGRGAKHITGNGNYWAPESPKLTIKNTGSKTFLPYGKLTVSLYNAQGAVVNSDEKVVHGETYLRTIGSGEKVSLPKGFMTSAPQLGIKKVVWKYTNTGYYYDAANDIPKFSCRKTSVLQ